MKLKRRDLLGLGISTAALAACNKFANAPSNKSSGNLVAANTDASSAKLRLGFQPPYVVVPLIDGEGYQLNYVALFGRIDYIEENPEVVQKFLQAYKQAITWAKNNRQPAVDILVKQNKLSPEAADLTFSRRNLILEPPNNEYRQELLKQSQLLTRLGLIEQQPNWNKAIDTTLAQTVAAS